MHFEFDGSRSHSSKSEVVVHVPGNNSELNALEPDIYCVGLEKLSLASSTWYLVPEVLNKHVKCEITWLQALVGSKG